MTDPTAEPTWEECQELLENLPGLEVESRTEAFERLVRSSSPEVRSQALHLGAAVLSDQRLSDYLHDDDDAVMRNAGLEILKMRGSRSLTLAIDLLEDPDPDVALQAVLILDHLKNPRALEPVRRQLRHRDTNIIQAAITAIGHLGDARAVEDLIPFLHSDPWLQLAAVEALGDLRAQEAIPHLAELLTDLMAGPLAAEVLARIGGGEAFRQLALHWLRFEPELEAEAHLSLLAHVLEGLPRTPEPIDGLEASLERHLGGEDLAISAAASRCLLALGPGRAAGQALETVALANPDPSVLPPSLRHREDLIGPLLEQEGTGRSWGFLLSRHHPQAAPREPLAKAMSKVGDPKEITAVGEALKAIDDASLDGALLDLYIRLPTVHRSHLHRALAARRIPLLRLIGERSDLDLASRLVLRALLGEAAEPLAEEIRALEPASRAEAISQLLERQDILQQLPWTDWLARDPRGCGPLAATVAASCGMRDLLPQLRVLLDDQPGPELVRCLGEMRDRESVPRLASLIHEGSELAPLALASLGEIGGEAARQVLTQSIDSGDNTLQRVAYRALSQCATEEDEILFRDAVGHNDWNVRLACAEVLGRSGRAEHLGSLARLVADPVSIVSQRAQAFLEP